MRPRGAPQTLKHTSANTLPATSPAGGMCLSSKADPGDSCNQIRSTSTAASPTIASATRRKAYRRQLRAIVRPGPQLWGCGRAAARTAGSGSRPRGRRSLFVCSGWGCSNDSSCCAKAGTKGHRCSTRRLCIDLAFRATITHPHTVPHLPQLTACHGDVRTDKLGVHSCDSSQLSLPVASSNKSAGAWGELDSLLAAAGGHEGATAMMWGRETWCLQPRRDATQELQCMSTGRGHVPTSASCTEGGCRLWRWQRFAYLPLAGRLLLTCACD